MKPILPTFLLLMLGITCAMGQEPADTAFHLGSRWSVELAPDDEPYPEYVADPRRPRLNVNFGLADSDIPETSSSRAMLNLGTRFSLLKLCTITRSAFSLIKEIFLENKESYLKLGTLLDFY